MANSKSKGSSEERNVCRALSKWLTGNEKPYQFWRTSNSGGTSTVIKENVHMTGDITAITPEARWFADIFSIEIKCGYGDADFHKHLKPNSKPTQIEEFWAQCNTDADRANKLPMLIWRKKGYPIVVGISKPIEDLLPYNSKITGRLKCVSMMFPYSNGKKTLPPLYFYNFEDFFELIKPNDMKGLINNAKTVN